ncbi:MAG TPA: toprim domain-containing protein, partial [Ktedonobacterales bacterium]|nr:toprim domain-containing protein [Ktedonobacterales bacterium]
TFVEKQQGLDFHDALVYLAERAGVALNARSSEEGPAPESAETVARKRLRALNEAAAIWFHSQLLQATEAQYARSYLDSRGVNNESIGNWRLGYAPDGDYLARYLLGQGYSEQELTEAGLARVRDAERGAGMYDYFRNRLIFPIRDGAGRTIAFGGRELGSGQPKYLNTPQTPLFDKSATLFGLDLARDAIRRGNRVIIVEGYMDVIVPYQHGTRNVVACIGSAITEKHIRQIKKLTRRVTLALDPDAAGESATIRGITVAQQAFDRVAIPVPGPASGDTRARKRAAPEGIVRFEEQVDAEITVARLPAGEDPDEFVRRDPAGWQRAIEQADPLIDFLFDAQTADLALNTPQGKMEACKRLLPIIAEVRSRTLAGEYADRLAMKLRLDVKDVQRDLALARQRLDREARTAPTRAPIQEPPDPDEESSDTAQKSHGAQALSSTTYRDAAHAPEVSQEEYCLGLALDHPETWREVRAILREDDFTATETRALFSALDRAYSGDPAPGLETLLAQLEPALLATVERARERVALQAEREGPALLNEASQAAYRLKRMRLKGEQAELDALIREAEQTSDSETLRALLTRKGALLAQRRVIDEASQLQG